jgi:hypothetical protein
MTGPGSLRETGPGGFAISYIVAYVALSFESASALLEGTYLVVQAQ